MLSNIYCLPQYTLCSLSKRFAIRWTKIDV